MERWKCELCRLWKWFLFVLFSVLIWSRGRSVVQPAEGTRFQLSRKNNKHSFGPFLETERTQEKRLLWAFTFHIFSDDLLKIYLYLFGILGHPLVDHWCLCQGYSHLRCFRGVPSCPSISLGRAALSDRFFLKLISDLGWPLLFLDLSQEELDGTSCVANMKGMPNTQCLRMQTAHNCSVAKEWQHPTHFGCPSGAVLSYNGLGCRSCMYGRWAP